MNKLERNHHIERIRRLADREQPRGPQYAQTTSARRPTAAGDKTIYAIVIQSPEYNDPAKNKYIVQRATVNEGQWVGDGNDIEIVRALGYEGYGTDALDIRNWLPWYPVNSIVRIIQHYDATAQESVWFIAESMLYGGPEHNSSLRYNEDAQQSEAVWV